MTAAHPQTGVFAQRLLDFLDIVEYRRADAQEDREPIYRLRYDAYKRDKNISSGFTASAGDYFDESANCHVFGLYIAGELVSSIRVNICSRENAISPTMSIFPDLLEQKLEQGSVFVDPSRFVISSEATSLHPELIYATLRLVPMAAYYHKGDYCLATVRPEHNAFYNKVFMAEKMSEPRLYPSLSKPVNMLGGRLDKLKKKVLAKYPIMDAHYIEQRMLFNPGHWPALPARHTSLPESMPAHFQTQITAPESIGLQ